MFKMKIKVPYYYILSEYILFGVCYVILLLLLPLQYYAPVICIHGPLGAGDIGDIAGL